VLAIVAPGQGSQKPGMLSAWLDLPGLDAELAGFSSAASLDLAALGTTAGADDIKDTSVTQPLVVAAALLAASRIEAPPDAVIAGHSVGELAAAAVAGVLTPDDATGLAGIRGRAMALACQLTPTSMAAVLGGDQDSVLADLSGRGLVGANMNGGGQIVAAGPADALAQLAASPPPGTRVIPLPVAGAFHTSYMSSAEDALRNAVADLGAADPHHTLLTNSTGEVVTSGVEFLRLLVRQVTRPVRWDLCMSTFSSLGVTGVLELPPAGALVGLVKRELKGVATLAVKGPEDLDKAAGFIAEHAGAAVSAGQTTGSEA
jgi:[acyl-carrier-protein] S-malonyltransferase